MRELAGTITLYQPDQNKITQNILSYLSYIDCLYVIDNSDQYEKLNDSVLNFFNQNPKIKYIKNQKNEGVAKALNIGVNEAAEEYEWLMTMDQDSYFDADQIKSYIEIFKDKIIHRKDV